jgi:hypothetical protein
MVQVKILEAPAFERELLTRMRQGPCLWGFFDESRQRYVIFDTEQEARDAWDQGLPPGIWRPQALHWDGCTHNVLREHPQGEVAAVMELIERMRTDQRQSPN